MNTYNFLKDKHLKSAYEWHCFFVFEDKEFLKDLEKLDVSYQAYVNNPSPKLNKKPILDYIDKKFVLADKYRINHLDLERFRNPRLNSASGIDYNVIEVLFDWNSQNIAAILPLSIKKKEYIEAWNLIRELQLEHRLKQKKVKGPERPDLIYAIFKARMGQKTYREIFNDYKAKSLPGYSGSPTRSLYTVELLKQYYLKYRPKQLVAKDIL